MTLHRRGFLGGLAAALAAPAIITTPGLLMPVRPQPRRLILRAPPLPDGYQRISGGMIRMPVFYEPGTVFRIRWAGRLT